MKVDQPARRQSILRTLIFRVQRVFGRATKKTYIEDFLRVYPGNFVFNAFGIRRRANSDHHKNFTNHRKFYSFCSQFADGKIVADAGCGSGYGSQILKAAGAKYVAGSDVSKKAISFATKNFHSCADFTVQSITELNAYADSSFDLVVCNEVLEHVKEYSVETQAILELKRIAKPGSLIIVGTPNSELMDDHGFEFHELRNLLSVHFRQFRIFENALIPEGAQRSRWERRLAEGHTGVIISEKIDLSAVPFVMGTVETKLGAVPGVENFGPYQVNTALLHNTHSWVVLAIRE